MTPLRPLTPTEHGLVAERARRLFLRRLVRLEAQRMLEAHVAAVDAKPDPPR